MLRDDDRPANPNVREAVDESSQAHETNAQGEGSQRETAEERTAPGEQQPDRTPDEAKPDDKTPDRSLKDDRKDGRSDAKAKDDEPGEDEDDGPHGLIPFIKAHPIGFGIAGIILLAVLVGGGIWYLNARHYEATDDAFIDGRSFSVAPKVGGYLPEVLVTDIQHVRAGDVIARIDDRDYRASLESAEGQLQGALANVKSSEAQIRAQVAQVEQARAQIAQAEAALKFSQDEQKRALDLAQRGAGTVQREQQTASDLTQSQANLEKARAAFNAAERQIAVLQAQQKSAEASVVQAQAQVDQAKLNLSYTSIVAAQAGRIARLTGAKGQLAQAGTAISMFVPDDIWVTANYKETQLTDMRPGQPVWITIDAYPDRELKGHVDSVQPGSGTAFSLLPAQNATGNYVKVVQRVPVKLVFDDLPTDVTIGPGMSVVPKVRVR